MFDTYGPFVLEKYDGISIDDFYRQIQNDEAKNLQSGVGIYIVGAKADGNSLLPWYVGMTSREFGSRLVEHLKGGKFAELAEKGPLYFYLIAISKDGRVSRRDEITEQQRLIIEQIEQQLIDHCVRRNEHLLNKKKWSPNQIHVPGFIDKGRVERAFPAAQKLAELLGT